MSDTCPRRAAPRCVAIQQHRILSCCRDGILFALLAMAVLFAPACGAQEIAPFRLTGYEGSIVMDYWRENLRTEQGQPGAPDSGATRTTQTDLRIGAFVMTHSYVYHPNLLTIDFGIGPIFERGTYATNESSTTSQEPLYDLDARATFLKDKPYTGSAYYQHLNPTVLVSPGEALIQQTTKYGFDFSLLAPVTPMPIRVEAWRQHTEGKGADRLVDNQVDQLSFSTSRAFPGYGNSTFGYVGTRQESSSGSPNLPIQSSSLTSNGFTLDSDFTFGANRQWQFTNPISYTSQKYALQGGETLNLDQLRATALLFGTQSEALTTRVRYDLNATTQNDFRNNTQLVGAGLTYSPNPNLTASANAAADFSRATDANVNRYGIDGSVRYQYALPVGTASLAYGLLVAKREQEAKETTGAVFGEQVTLVGTIPVPLQRDLVVPGSVVVNNATRTQVYVEGLDYVLSTVGLKTRIQRQAAGNILSGEAVLVDYAYDTGGTFAYRQFDNSFDVGWYLGSYASARVHYFDSRQTLLSGQPLFPLNSIRDWLATVTADVPIRALTDVYVGGLAEYEDHWETISPYTRQTFNAYFQTSLPNVEWAGFRIGARRSRTDYLDQASADVNLTAYDLWAWAYAPIGIDFVLNVATERDTGGVVPRSYDYATLKALWRVRQVLMTLSGSYSRDEQGDFSKRRAYTQFTVRRDF